MSKVYFYIAWFLALNGITRYYPNKQTGRLQSSWYLWCYSLVHSLLSICGLPAWFVDHIAGNPTLRLRFSSHWVNYANWIYVLLNVTVMLACVYCAHALQSPIYRMLCELQKLQGIKLRSAEHRYLFFLLYAKLSLVAGYLILMIFAIAWQWSTTTFLQFLCIFYKFWTTIMTSATSLLIYGILWKICYCGIAIQAQLEGILGQTDNVSLKQLHRLYKDQQILISINMEFCETFRHVLLFYPMRILCTGVLSVYFLIRIRFGHSNTLLTPGLEWVILILIIHAFTEFYLLNSLAGAVAELIRNTLSVLRQAQAKDPFLERASSWMSLQLSRQSTEIQIFGIVTLNRRLWFSVMAQIVLHTLYMTQSDYYLIV